MSLAATGSGELNSWPEHWTSGGPMVKSQLESVSLTVVPYLNPSSTEFLTGELFAGFFAVFKGDLTPRVQLVGLTVSLKKDCSLFCVGPMLAAFAALTLFPEGKLWWLEKAALRPARFRDDFRLWVTGSSPDSGVLSLDGTTLQISGVAVVSRDKKHSQYYTAII